MLAALSSPTDTPQQFEQAFEIGVKSGADGRAHHGRTAGVAASSQATYKGNGGQGVIADMDALYAQAGVDPGAWKGPSKAESSLATELKGKGKGAYSSKAPWVVGKGPAELTRGGHGASLKAAPGFNVSHQVAWVAIAHQCQAEDDAKRLRKAMKGLSDTKRTNAYHCFYRLGYFRKGAH